MEKKNQHPPPTSTVCTGQTAGKTKNGIVTLANYIIKLSL
jgi:hypothetical protein